MQVDIETDKITGSAATVSVRCKSPLKITVAPNGARRQKRDHVAVPINTAETALAAKACAAAGAYELHLHVRDELGRHSLSVNTYEQTIAAISAIVPGISIQVTSEAAGRFGVTEQFDLLRELRPQAASISVREMSRDLDLAAQVYALCDSVGIDVQHILYDQSDLERLRGFLAEGILPQSMRRVLMVFGRFSEPQEANPDEVAPFVTALGDDFPDWTVCAFGRTELAVAEIAIELGGHVRVGFENNFFRPDGAPLRDNAESVAAVVELARAAGRPLLKEHSS
ncbi:3-keto-5-aminohexanoate cleavage protein [Epibacterium ulvae]|uniref:3-keto-5-aminohexanoate cleavage protein n=1 Tax=Epibacterium ulvae TaxID=1156985 RepID=UPI001BFCA006|nr:3-keto-5-aminohexanoate cleavage protein [Epibacterium ulvae]MBT8154127.1 3-keto-5-aminohexanoate cleavage protein [Epibacterium ulvae]